MAYETILSGDLNGDDVPVTCKADSPDCDSFGGRCVNGICITRQANSENSYHVVTGSGANETAVFDGFTITGGNADGSSTYDYGGGMYNPGGKPTIATCLFRGNSGYYGGGMYSGGWPGDGNFSVIPMFENADGDDDIPETEDDNLHLLPTSPCIDRGDPKYDPEANAMDLDGNVRVVDGDGDRAAIVDMGAYEYQPGDFDKDYDVDLDDFTVLADLTKRRIPTKTGKSRNWTHQAVARILGRT